MNIDSYRVSLALLNYKFTFNFCRVVFEKLESRFTLKILQVIIKNDSLLLKEFNLRNEKLNKIPSKIDLSKGFLSPKRAPKSGRLEPLSNQTNINQTEVQQQIPTRKYPFVKQEFVSIEELRSRVHKGSTGVLPLRKSQDLDELNVILKGKPFQTNVEENIDENEEQKDDDSYMSEDDEEDYYQDHAALNTPATYHNPHSENVFQSPFLSMYNEFNANGVLKPVIGQKPAILPTTGTSTNVTFSSRPKPSKKEKIVQKIKKRPKNVKADGDESKPESRQRILPPNATEYEIEQFELENQVKNLLNEAREIASSKKISPLKKRAKSEFNSEASNLTEIQTHGKLFK